MAGGKLPVAGVGLGTAGLGMGGMGASEGAVAVLAAISRSMGAGPTAGVWSRGSVSATAGVDDVAETGELSTTGPPDAETCPAKGEAGIAVFAAFSVRGEPAEGGSGGWVGEGAASEGVVVEVAGMSVFAVFAAFSNGAGVPVPAGVEGGTGAACSW